MSRTYQFLDSGVRERVETKIALSLVIVGSGKMVFAKREL